MSIDLVAGRISLGGELSRHTVHHLLDAARTLSAVPHLRWVIEADNVRSCDSTGLRAISACYRRALRGGATMSITGANPALRRALASLRLDNHLIDGESDADKVSAPKAYPLAKVYEIAAAPTTTPSAAPVTGLVPDVVLIDAG